MRSWFYRAIAGAVALLAVIVGLGAFSSARAAYVTSYYVYVNGVCATSENYEDLLGDGTVSYDPKTNTLCLKDAKITKGLNFNFKTYGIYCLKDGVTITGSAEISDVDCGIDSMDPLIFDKADIDIALEHQDGKEGCSAIRSTEITIKDSTLNLTLNVPEGVEAGAVLTDAIFCEGPDNHPELHIEGSDIKIDGFRYAIYNPGSCDVKNSKLDLKSLEGWYNLKTLTFNGEDTYADIVASRKGSTGLRNSFRVEINDAHVSVKGASAGIRAYVTLMTGSTAQLDATATDPVKDLIDYYGMDTVYLYIKGGKINATGGEIGLSCAKDMEVSGESTEIIATGSELALEASASMMKLEEPLVIRYPAHSAIVEGRLQVDGKDATYVEIGKPHTLTLVPYKAPTLTAEGNKAYYTCSDCEKWFWDSDAIQLIEDHSSVIIPKLDPTPTPTSAPATPTPTASAQPTGAAATPTSGPSAAPTGADVTGAPTAAPSGAALPTVAPSGDPKSQILAFVERIYIYVLDREPETEGAAFWSEELWSFRRTGAEVAQGFIFSDEFVARNTSDKEFVTILYKTFFGRDPEEEGMNFWLAQLSSGAMDRVAVANGFIYSQEWADTCASYGIRSGGELKPNGVIEPTALTYAFVERMYTTAMGRGYDEEGRQYWASELANFNITGEQCGASFFLSAEMEGYGLSDKEFLGRLYATFMNREADADGEAYWLSQMSAGVPRADIVFGFTRSPEFTDKCVEARILPY